MIKTFAQLQEIDSVIEKLYKATPTLKDTKFGYAYKRFCDKFFIPAIKERANEFETIRLDNALEDPKTKEVLVDSASSRGYKYSKEGLKKLIQEENDLVLKWEEKEIEFEPFISSYVPEKLTEEDKEILTGVII